MAHLHLKFGAPNRPSLTAGCQAQSTAPLGPRLRVCDSEAGAPPRRNASGDARGGAAGLRPARPQGPWVSPCPTTNFGFGEGEALATLRRTLRRRLAGAKPRPQNSGTEPGNEPYESCAGPGALARAEVKR